MHSYMGTYFFRFQILIAFCKPELHSYVGILFRICLSFTAPVASLGNTLCAAENIPESKILNTLAHFVFLAEIPQMYVELRGMIFLHIIKFFENDMFLLGYLSGKSCLLCI